MAGWNGMDRYLCWSCDMSLEVLVPTISEPLTKRHSWTYTRCRAAFLSGQIGPVTFLVSLQLIGLSPSDAEAEVNLARMEKRR